MKIKPGIERLQLNRLAVDHCFCVSCRNALERDADRKLQVRQLKGRRFFESRFLLRELRGLDDSRRPFDLKAPELELLIEKTVPVELNHELFDLHVHAGRSPADPGERQMPPVAVGLFNRKPRHPAVKRLRRE